MGNSEYVESINSLIPEASRIAYKRVGKLKNKFKVVPGKDGRNFNFCRWTQFFHEAMAELTSEAGLR